MPSAWVEDVQDIVARNLRAARVKKGLSQEELAHLASLDRTYVSGIERRVRNPTIVVLAKLAAVLGTTASALIQGDPQP